MIKTKIENFIRSIVREEMDNKLTEGIDVGTGTTSIRDDKVHITASQPSLQLEGTEGSAENLSIRENAGQIELYDEAAGSVAGTWDLNPILERASQDTEWSSSSQTAAYTTTDEEVIYADSSGGAFTITLASSDVSDGNIIAVTDVAGSAGTNAITIDTESSETIDGASSVSISSNYGQTVLVSDGTNWYTLA